MQGEHLRGTKLKKKLGVNLDISLIIILLEVARKYMDSGMEVSARNLAYRLNLPLKRVLDAYDKLKQRELIHMTHDKARDDSGVRPSQTAYEALRNLARGLERQPLILTSVYRQSKASLALKFNLDLFEGFPNSSKQLKWKRIKFRFRNLGLTVYLYENGIVDFKGRDTSEIHERIALSKILSFAGQKPSYVMIKPYKYSVTVDMHNYIESINLEELVFEVDRLNHSGNLSAKIRMRYDPEYIGPFAYFTVRFDDSRDECTILLWSTGRFLISGVDFPLVVKTFDLFFENVIKEFAFNSKDIVSKNKW
jgi:hypothetical protein